MKRSRKALIVVLTSLMLFSIFVAAWITLMPTHESTDKNNELSHIQASDLTKKLESAIPQSYFGGIYIAEGNNIVVNVTDPEEVCIESIIASLKNEYNNANISYKKVDKPLEMLKAAQEKLTPYMKEYNIATLGIDIKENRIEIELYEESEDISELIEKHIDPKYVNITLLPQDYKIILTG